MAKTYLEREKSGVRLSPRLVLEPYLLQKALLLLTISSIKKMNLPQKNHKD